MEKKNNKKYLFWDIFFTTVLVLSLSFIVARIFFIDYGKCSGDSMEPTIKNGAYLLANQNYSSIERNDIVFATPEEFGESVLKRVVAVGGDHVVIKDNTLYINDVADTMFPNASYEEDIDITVPANEYYLMGDNRENSIDSREFGFVKENEVEAKIFYFTKNFTFPVL